MHFSSLTFALLAGIVKCAPVAEGNDKLNPAYIDIQEAILLNSADLSTGATPSYCSFPSNGFWYLPFDYKGRQACIGIDTQDEREGPWSDKEYNDIFSAMDEQVTKDGGWKSSRVGCWTAFFEKRTSAVPDREGYKNAFRWAVETGNGLRDEGFKRFYFQLDGQYTSVGRLAIC